MVVIITLEDGKRVVMDYDPDTWAGSLREYVFERAMAHAVKVDYRGH